MPASRRALLQQQSNPLSWNQIGFALRRWLSWNVHTYQEPKESKTGIFIGNALAQTEEARLTADYNLSAVQHHATGTRYRETLSYLLWLDVFQRLAPDWFAPLLAAAKAFEAETNCLESAEPSHASLAWLDVGAKNWSYVEALSAFLQAGGLQCFVLDGVELDPYRRYADLHTRAQYAEAHSRAILQSRYHAGDIHDWRQPAHIISSFLPFVFPEPHTAWGLPSAYFRPEAQLKHLFSLLEPGGLLLIVNQGPVEAEAQASLLASVAREFPLEWREAGQLPAPFIEYLYPRYGWICRKRSEMHDGQEHGSG